MRLQQEQAAIGGGTRTDIGTLSAYARALGTAYQIHDDDVVDGIQSGSRSIALDLTDMCCSQDEYLQEMAALNTREACAQLQHLQSSEAKCCLEQLSTAIDSGTLYRM
ncbi:MAG: hypothetical protein LUP95_01810 [Euryarchaeota archaeon]|nr:hypothetical protein [Euryarchaeota archaeon]